MTDEEATGGRHAALASDARRQVLELLMDSGAPLDAAAVAAQVGLHITTVRFHLEQLEGAGLIRRAVERAGARGRPRILFTAGPASREDEAKHDLSRALAGALAEDADGGRARAIRAGEHWAASFAGELWGSAGEGVAPLVRILDRLGFDPELEVPIGEVPGAAGPVEAVPALDGTDAPAPDVSAPPVVNLLACPFRADARQAPDVICSVHLGLIRGIAESLGHDPEGTELRPFVGPELCQVRLRGSWVAADAEVATEAVAKAD
ncbi:ArsR family transcriptional regulator [Cryobacterium algoritolerans]|uniref:ArsR family transcriptional regulator n=1 Tax=Cryobacterium algoritolerans TaxID=1259184 RepID=A0A4R8X2H3_9MICO|nr:helix-turn-helix domain-containing protein [Cryobacterium algoritolerans]TFC21546.1 ArsR family transcriptional regulator [Cryobacterium algoritolerans]